LWGDAPQTSPTFTLWMGKMPAHTIAQILMFDYLTKDEKICKMILLTSQHSPLVAIPSKAR
jgi:hypothetical protein